MSLKIKSYHFKILFPVFRGKNPRIPNPPGLYFQWHFNPGLQEIGTFLPKFLFPGFFPGKSSPVIFLHRFNRKLEMRIKLLKSVESKK